MSWGVCDGTRFRFYSCKKKGKSRQFCSLIGSAGTHMGTQCQRTFLRKSTNLGACNFVPVLFWFLFFYVVNGSKWLPNVLMRFIGSRKSF